MASKYRPLTDFLAAQSGESVRLAFTEIEQIVGFRLPASARQHRQWWENQTSSRRVPAGAWLDVGWSVAPLGVDLRAETVIFRRMAR
jgi:hypothetical protein